MKLRLPDVPLARSLASVVPLAVALGHASGASAQVILTEFLASNDTVLMDEDGSFEDWIEIHNPTAADIDLTGWTVTDDDADSTKWTFPGEILPADGYLVVFASNKDRVVPGATLHTNFKLSAGGEYLGLYRPDGTLAQEFAPEYPPQSADISYGLGADFVTQGFFDPPTPGAPNEDGAQPLEAISVDVNPGYQTGPVSVLLTQSEPTATIYYTLDGRVPEPTDTIFDGTPLAFSETTTLRARAFALGFLPSSVLTASYLYPDDVQLQSDKRAVTDGFPAQWIDEAGVPWLVSDPKNPGNDRPGAWYGFDEATLSPYTTLEIEEALTSIPSLSVVMHPDDLFGYMAPSGRSGIYPNSEGEDDFWERSCSLEWIDPNGGPEIQVDCGTSIQGGSSTSPSIRGQLSMALKFKSRFGPSKLEFDVFEDSEASEFDYLVLDACNQLSINGPASGEQKRRAQEMRDRFISDLHDGMGHLSPSGRYVHLYLNGLYWGVFFLHERPDERFASASGPGEEEEYDWIKRGTVEAGNNNSSTNANPGRWREVRSIVASGLKPKDQWIKGESAYESLCDRVDMENYIDYMLLNWYGGNTDWPQNNWMATARARLSADLGDVNPDGKFKFHVWDAEAVLYWGGAATAVNDGFWDRTTIESNVFNNISFIHTAAKNHPDYVTLFKDRVQQHLLTPGGALYVEPGYDAPGTAFDPLHPERNQPAALYAKLAAELGPAVFMEYARWGSYFNSPGYVSLADWELERDRLLTDYFPIRSGVLLQQLETLQPALVARLAAPTSSLPSGAHSAGETLSLFQADGDRMYYTLDGTDPRESLGFVSPGAQVYMGPLTLATGTYRLCTRCFDGREWSAMTCETLLVGYDVRINEIQSDNGITLADEAGEFDDWIELRNLGDVPLELGGFYLTDDETEPTQFEIPMGVVVPAQGYLILWADDDLDQGDNHLGFKLSGNGEFVGLYAPDFLGNGPLDEIEFPALDEDQSFARSPDGTGDFVISSIPTPGGSNTP